MLRKITDTFLSAWALMSRIPLPGPHRFVPAGIPFFFPVIGLIVSIFSYVTMRICMILLPGFPPYGVTAAMVLLAQYWAFNLFHFDGFLDSIDALFSFKKKDDRIAILSDSHIGSFAFFFGFIYLAMKVFILAHAIDVLPAGPLMVLFLYPMAGRMGPQIVSVCLHPAKKTGLGAEIGRIHPVKAAVVFGIGALLSLAAAYPVAAYCGAGLPAVLISLFSSALVSGFAVSLLYRIKIGGFTGDALGFSIELGELLYLLFFICAVL